MVREALVLAAAAGLLIVVAAAAAAQVRRAGRLGRGAQVLIGLCCGAIGALVAVAPYVDLVPDGAEPLVAVGTAAIVLGTIVKVVQDKVQRSRGDRTGQHHASGREPRVRR